MVLDEFHERHLEGDLALALLRRLQRTDAARSADRRHVGHARCRAHRGVPGRRARAAHPKGASIRSRSSTPRTPPRRSKQQVAAALERLAATAVTATCWSSCPALRKSAVRRPPARRSRSGKAGCLLPLHGDQSPEEQDRAVAPSDRRKVILSTNVAESSITIEGVSAVIDSGLARIAEPLAMVGPADAAGRRASARRPPISARAAPADTGPGRAIRLYPLEDFVRRPAQDPPEIVRADLAPTALLLRAHGAARPEISIGWIAPPAAAVEHADESARAAWRATGDTGREMARYPLHPRLARLIVEARRRGVAEDGCTVAALLSAGERLPARPDHATRSDLLVLMESQWEPRTAQTCPTDPPHRRSSAAAEPRRGRAAHLRPGRVSRSRRAPPPRRRTATGRRGSGALAPSTRLSPTPNSWSLWRPRIAATRRLPLVRIASAVEPEWLLDLFPERVREVAELEWNRAAERVEVSRP